MNTKALRRAVKEATGWFHLSDLEEKTLDDDIVAMFESQEEMGSIEASAGSRGRQLRWQAQAA